MTASSGRRRYTRFGKGIPTVSKILRTSEEVPGTTDNLCQGGAFIISPSWSDFQVGDQAEIEFIMPPTFTGQKDTLILKGPGTIRRVDGGKGGIAVEFQKKLRAFEASWGYECKSNKQWVFLQPVCHRGRRENG